MKPPQPWTDFCWLWWHMPERPSAALYAALAASRWARPSGLRVYMAQ